MKKLTSSFIMLCLTVSYCMLAVGQPAVPVPVPQGRSVVIPDGSEIEAVTTELITSKTATEGDPITFKVDENLKIDGSVVIAKGTIIKGTVSEAKSSGAFGRGGKLSVRIESTQTVDKQKIHLRASKGKQGDDKTGTTVALVILFGPLGLLKKGKQAEIKEGTRVRVFTDEAKTVVVDGPIVP